jgi:macrolide-specific efflux system membrane fusion protein
MRNKKWKIVLALLIVVCLGVIFVVILKQKQPSAASIKLINPTYGTIQTSITTTATVTPENRLAIKPPVNGRVDKILVKEGDYVKVGQTLALMSSTERATVLDSARAHNKAIRQDRDGIAGSNCLARLYRLHDYLTIDGG